MRLEVEQIGQEVTCLNLNQLGLITYSSGLSCFLEISPALYIPYNMLYYMLYYMPYYVLPTICGTCYMNNYINIVMYIYLYS